MTDTAKSFGNEELTAQQLDLLLSYAAVAVIHLGPHHNAMLERLQRARDRARLLSPLQRAEAILEAR